MKAEDAARHGRKVDADEVDRRLVEPTPSIASNKAAIVELVREGKVVAFDVRGVLFFAAAAPEENTP